MAYDLPNTLNMSSGLQPMFKYVSEVTNSWFFNMILIAIYLIFAVGFYNAKRDIFGGMAVGGFAVIVLGTLFWVANLISGWTFSIAMAFGIISVATLWLPKPD